MISSCRADPVAATGQFSCPPAGRHLAVSGQSLVTVVRDRNKVSEAVMPDMAALSS